MAWCTVCNEKREIAYRTIGDSRAMPTVSDRYNREGEYIGYEEGETYKTTVDSIPVCKWCGTKFEFPTAQSKDQYFYAKKDLSIKQLQSRISMSYQPKEGSKGPAIVISMIAGVAAILGIGRVTGNYALALFLGIAIILGVAYLMYRLFSPRKKEERYEAERQSLGHELEDLQAMQFSEQNYQSLKNM